MGRTRRPARAEPHALLALVMLFAPLVVACRHDKKADGARGKVPLAAGGAPTAAGDALVEDAFDYEVKSWTRSLDAYDVVIEDVGMTTAIDAALEKAGGDLAVNGGFFDQEGKAVGLTMSNGLRLSSYAKKASGGVLTISEGKATLFETESFEQGEGVRFAVQCRPRLVVSGKVNIKSDDGKRSARTALCVRDAGKTIEAVLVRGGEGGPSLFTLSKWLLEHGCEDALNLDGGPSTSAAWMEGEETKKIAPRGPIRHAIVFKKRS